jgi:hypothetical protein
VNVEYQVLFDVPFNADIFILVLVIRRVNIRHCHFFLLLKLLGLLICCKFLWLMLFLLGWEIVILF